MFDYDARPVYPAADGGGLEDARARQVYGVPSGVNTILIINRVIAPDRVTAILVKERLGF